MKQILFLTTFLFISVFSYSQDNLSDLNDEGIELFNRGKKEEAIKIWKKILRKAPNSSRNYGMAANNLLFAWFKEGDLAKTKSYWELIIHSNLNDEDENPDIMEPYANYRHHATMRMASLHAKNEEFQEALDYIYLADNKYTYKTSSLTSYIFKKVDLAFWKFRLYKDLDNPEMAKYVMIERGLNNDYVSQFPDWASYSPGNDEVELAETLFKEYSAEELKQLKKDMDKAFNSMEIIKRNGKTFSTFSLQGMEYEIPLYQNTDPSECAQQFRNSVLYALLTKTIENQGTE